ncbi:MAG: hypothetical protein U0790_06220 [Isosphaeraceae bacterium]
MHDRLAVPMITTWQIRLFTSPGGEVLSVFRWKTISALSFVIVTGSAVTLFGRPSRVAFASPGKSAALLIVTPRSTSPPCSTLAEANLSVR